MSERNEKLSDMMSNVRCKISCYFQAWKVWTRLGNDNTIQSQTLLSNKNKGGAMPSYFRDPTRPARRAEKKNAAVSKINILSYDQRH